MPSRLPNPTAGWGEGEAKPAAAREPGLARSALGKLKPTEREAVVLHLVGGLDAAQVAEACGIDLRRRAAGSRAGFTARSGGEEAMSNTTCLRFEEDIVGLLEGTASESLKEHVATCDFCRDARHDLENVARLVGRAGDDFEYTPALAERLAAAVVGAAASRISETRIRESNEAAARAAAAARRPRPRPRRPPRGRHTRRPPSPTPLSSLLQRLDSSSASPSPSASASAPRTKPPSKKALWLLLAACASVGISTVVGFKLADRQRSPELAATRAWHGKVAKVARSGADKNGGLSVTTPSGKADLGDGSEIKAGMRLSTDGRTRARIELDDGSFLVLDRATDLTFDSAPRTITLVDGAILADVAQSTPLPARSSRPRPERSASSGRSSP